VRTACSPLLHRAQHGGHDLLHGETAGIEGNGVRRGPQRGQAALAILPVALVERPAHLVERLADSAAGQLGVTRRGRT
jgi:hypothetical protein